MNPQPDEPQSGEMAEHEIDENLAGSFPASDPPAWTLGTDHRDPDHDDDADEKGRTS
jgi:hypothetical protein